MSTTIGESDSMSNVHLRGHLPQIDRLFSFGVTAGLSDGLVHRYCVGG